MRFKPRGFSNRGIDASVVPNGTYFTNGAWLPEIGYQADRGSPFCPTPWHGGSLVTRNPLSGATSN